MSGQSVVGTVRRRIHERDSAMEIREKNTLNDVFTPVTNIKCPSYRTHLSYCYSVAPLPPLVTSYNTQQSTSFFALSTVYVLNRNTKAGLKNSFLCENIKTDWATNRPAHAIVSIKSNIYRKQQQQPTTAAATTAVGTQAIDVTKQNKI